MSFPLLGVVLRARHTNNKHNFPTTINDQIPTLSSLLSPFSLVIDRSRATNTYQVSEPNFLFLFFSSLGSRWAMFFFLRVISLHLLSFLFHSALCFGIRFVVSGVRVQCSMFFFCFSASCREGLSEPNAKSPAPLDVF